MNKYISTFLSTLSPFTNQIKDKFQPINSRYLELTQPIRTWHAQLSANSPIVGKVTSWGYKAFRYGFIFLLALIFLTMIGVFGHMPNKEELKTIENSNTTEIYSADSVLIGKYYIENRTEIGLENISPYVITALLAVEDKRFFEHSGIDLRSWFRVFKGLASSSGLGGGSTLSQQLAKNLYPRKDYYIPGVSILINKIKENIISIKLENIYDKEELLALYLNTVPFGGDRFGINVASRYFFKKKAKDLNPSESATLIGMLKATTALDPTRNPKNALKRRNLVLERMVKNSSFEFNDPDLKIVSSLINNGKLSQKAYDEIKDKPINAKRNVGDDTNDGRGAYFKEYLRINVMPKILKNLVKEDGSKYNLYRDGLKIYTTIDNRMQTFAEDAIQKHMSELQGKFNKHWKNYKGEEKAWGDDKWLEEQKTRSERYTEMKAAGSSDKSIEENFNTPVKMTIFTWKNGGGDTDTLMSPMDSIKHYFLMLNTGFMALDQSNGYIKSWVGGTNFKYFKYDHILSKRQVGSTFKPIVYAAAINDSIKPCQYFRNEQVTIIDWTPKNSDDKYGGWYSVYGGIINSINVIAAKLIEKVGIQKTLDLAAAMGVTAELPREFGISLGACDIQLYDMMKVYGTIANKGLRPEPVTVLMVKDRNGKVIYDFKEEVIKNPKLGPNVQALTEDNAAVMVRMMQGVIDQGTGRKFRDKYGAVGEYAGKTGTTQNQSDGWFINFNPYLTTGAWVGGPSRAVRFRVMDLGQGSAMALPIVGEFWKSIRNDKKLKKLTDTRFPENKYAINLVGCPFRIGIHPDTLNLLMNDSTTRDRIVGGGYRGLKDLVKEKYGSEYEDVSETGEILEGGGEEVVVPIKKDEDKKNDEEKKKLEEKKKAEEEKKKVDEKKVADEKKKLDEKKKIDEEKKKAAAKKIEDDKKKGISTTTKPADKKSTDSQKPEVKTTAKPAVKPDAKPSVKPATKPVSKPTGAKKEDNDDEPKKNGGR
jgi:penicillin-binding protein 1A